MRLSTNQIFSNSLMTMQKSQADLIKTETQITTGKRVVTAADDPTAASAAIGITQKIQLNAQYKNNATIAKGALGTEDAILSNIWDAMERVNSLLVQAGNSANGLSERQSIASEIETVRDQLFNDLNYKDSAGGYLFAGYQSTDVPYTLDANGRYVYNGDEGQRKIKITDEVNIPINDSGKEVFENVDTRASLRLNSDGGFTNVNINTTDQAAFDAFRDANYNTDTAVEIHFAPPNYEVRNSAGTVIGGPAPYTAGTPITFNGMEISLEGAGAGPVTFEINPPKDNILNSLTNVIDVFSSSTSTPEQRLEALKDASLQLSNAQGQVDMTRAKIGGRQNVIEALELANADVDIANKSARADLVEVDLSEAITSLSKQQFTLQAAQQTFSQVTNLSLFNFIR